jgi:tetratricopeptide (TPR) repeat protein
MKEVLNKLGTIHKAYFCFFVCACFLLSSGYCYSQEVKLDSLISVVKIMKEDTNKVNTFNSLSQQLWQSGDYPKSMNYANDAKSLGEKLNYKIGIAKSLTNIGVVYDYEGDFTKALEYYFKALKAFEEIKNTVGVAQRYGDIGNAYTEKGSYPKALEFFFKGLKLSEDLNDKMAIARSYNNIGVIYKDMSDYPQALEYYFKALKITEALGNKSSSAMKLGNIGVVLHQQNKYAEAKEYYFKALKIYEELQNKNGIARNISNIGQAYIDEGDSAKAAGNKILMNDLYSKALENCFKSLKITEELGEKSTIVANLDEIGAAYLREGKYKQAEEYLKKALGIANVIGDMNAKKEILENLSELYSEQKRWPLALENFKQYIITRDSIFNEDNTKKNVQAAMNYEFDKKQAADSIKNAALVKVETLKHDQEIHQQRIYSYGGALGFILMLIVAIVSLRAYRQKQKANEIIFHQKALVEEKQKEIVDSIHYAKRIQQSLLPTEKYIDKNLRRLKKQ